MKKIIVLLFTLISVFTLVSCKNKKTKIPNSNMLTIIKHTSDGNDLSINISNDEKIKYIIDNINSLKLEEMDYIKPHDILYTLKFYNDIEKVKTLNVISSRYLSFKGDNNPYSINKGEIDLEYIESLFTNIDISKELYVNKIDLEEAYYANKINKEQLQEIAEILNGNKKVKIDIDIQHLLLIKAKELEELKTRYPDALLEEVHINSFWRYENNYVMKITNDYVEYPCVEENIIIDNIIISYSGPKPMFVEITDEEVSKHKLTIKNNTSYELIGIKEEYSFGEEVEVTMFYDDCVMTYAYLDGKLIGGLNGMNSVKFSMPNKDSTLTISYNNKLESIFFTFLNDFELLSFYTETMMINKVDGFPFIVTTDDLTTSKQLENVHNRYNEDFFKDYAIIIIKIYVNDFDIDEIITIFDFDISYDNEKFIVTYNKYPINDMSNELLIAFKVDKTTLPSLDKSSYPVIVKYEKNTIETV